MSNEMVERVAKALEVILYAKGYQICAMNNKIALAKAAIEAMRRPTQEMIDAGYEAYDLKLETQWLHMIDAALKDG